MNRTPRGPSQNPASAFERVPLAQLQQGRRGKHHDLVGSIAAEITRLADGEAIKIPVGAMDVSLANLRAALNRAMKTRGVRIASFSDGESLFVWKKTARTARYERRRKSA